MEISSHMPSGYAVQQPASLNPDQTAQRWQLMQAAKSVNNSGLLGKNELVFSVDRQTHRPIIRVEDKETHEIVFQVPPEYVLNLARNFSTGSTQVSELAADM
jgi:flagellar protein FlaG